MDTELDTSKQPADAWPQLAAAIEATPPLPAPPRPKFLGRRLPRIPAILKPRRRFPPGVYIATYHSVPRTGAEREWERCYTKGVVTIDRFEAHLRFFLRHMTPLALSEVPGVFAGGAVDRPYFVVTFDDGYTNVNEHVTPVAARYGVRPAQFVIGGLAEGGVMYRVLAALLIKNGKAPALAARLREKVPQVAWTDEPVALFDLTKSHYVPGLVEEAVERVYRDTIGDPADLGVHITATQALDLVRQGWEIGNHTFEHKSLGKLGPDEVAAAFERNAAYWSSRGVPLIDWVCYPYGRVCDVNPAVGQWLDRNPDFHGVFSVGGVNLAPTRKEWLRFVPFAPNDEELGRFLLDEVRRTREAAAAPGR